MRHNLPQRIIIYKESSRVVLEKNEFYYIIFLGDG
jgi:hypothetical protein